MCVQGQAAAAQALEEAMAATREAAQRVDATVSILRQVQVRLWSLVQISITAKSDVNVLSSPPSTDNPPGSCIKRWHCVLGAFVALQLAPHPPA